MNTLTVPTTLTSQRFGRRAGLGVLALALCIVTAGCRKGGKPIHLYVGLDGSGSARGDIGGYALLVRGAIEQMQSGQDSCTFYRVDYRTEEFSDGVFDGDTEAALAAIVKELQAPAEHPGTYPADYFAQTADRVSKDPTACIVVLASDGDNDDARTASWQRMHDAAVCMAHAPNLRAVVICGASKENWERLRQAFKPLGGRLHLLSQTQLDGEALAPYIESARK